MASGDLEILVSRTSFQKLASTEELEFIIVMIFHDSTKINFVSKLNSRTWITLKSLVVIFQAYFIKEIPDSDDSIIPGTKMTSTSPFFLRNPTLTDFSTFSVGGC